jgi:agmatine deiminase
MRTRLLALPSVVLPFVLLGAGCAVSDEALVQDEDASEALEFNGRKVLPNWATPDEEAIARRAPAVDPRADTPPPPEGFRVPAEYEPVQTVVMTWAGHSPVLSGIAAATAQAGAEVWMVGGPAQIAGVAAAQYKAVPLGFNSIWARDYGPVGIDESQNKLAIVDTTYRHHAVRRDDDAMSCSLADRLEAGCFRTSLILDGGNYMTDGKGHVFVTSRVYDWNNTVPRARVDEMLKRYLHANQLTVLDYAKNAQGQPADGTGHMDMFAKLIAECKVLVAQTNDVPFKAVTDRAAAVFASTPCAEGRNYEVIRVKGWLRGRTWYTYTNSLIVNRSVIIPFYDTRAENEVAKRAYEAALPGYRIVGVNSESTIVQGGSIHCITKEIPSLPTK